MPYRVWCCTLILAAMLIALGAHPILADGPTTVSYAYDAAGRLVEARYGDRITISYTYDAAGNLLRRVVARGGVVYLPLILRQHAGEE
jgi:YD repeat-containing protein